MKILFMTLVLILSGCGKSYGPNAYGVSASLSVEYSGAWSTTNEFVKTFSDETSKMVITFSDDVAGLMSLEIDLGLGLKEDGYSYVYIQKRIGGNVVIEISFNKDGVAVNTDVLALASTTILIDSAFAVRY